MTYFGVLLRFIGPPLLVLLVIEIVDRARGRRVAPGFRTWPSWAVLLGHVGIALVYTTPWDNYLVATRVWWYEPALVTGLTLWWVPIEEYTFFVVQTLMAGLWVLFWMRRLAPSWKPADAPHCPTPASAAGLHRKSFREGPALRWITTALASLLWIVWLVLLLAGWARGRYMALLLVWFLPPVILQLAFGADILWHHRRLVLVGLLPPFTYLCLVDALAIRSGTWTINAQNTVGVDLLGILPLEEIAFFLFTSVLIVFGMVLMLARESHKRAGLLQEPRQWTP